MRTNTGQRRVNLLQNVYLCLMTERKRGKDDTTIASGLACLHYVSLTFGEGECMRQVHPRQTVMTSEEVPLLGAATLPSFLHPAGNSEPTIAAVCVCACLCACSFSNNLVLKGKHYMCSSDGLQCEYMKVTGEPQFSLA